LKQLQENGKSLRPGQSVRLIYTLGKQSACAWDLPTTFDPRMINIPRYRRLFDRAVDSVLEPIAGTDKSWLTQIEQLRFEGIY